MSEPIGMIFVCGDYSGDLRAIVDALNEWHFDSEGEIRFETNGGSIFAHGVGDYAEAYPTRLADNDADVLEEPVCLETVSRTISPFLKSGTLEIISWFTDALSRNVGSLLSVSRLIIRADGSTELLFHFIDAFDKQDWVQSGTKSYVPL